MILFHVLFFLSAVAGSLLTAYAVLYVAGRVAFALYLRWAKRTTPKTVQEEDDAYPPGPIA